MHLSSLTLKNVRQFEERTFKFQPGFNLLVGENGAGKTTILRCLLAALGGTQKMGWRPILEDDDVRFRRRHAEVKATVNSSNNRIEEFNFHKTLWERAERQPQRNTRPLVLHYSSNEATCSAMRVKRAKRTRDPKMEEFRREEAFLYEMEAMEFERRRSESDEPRFGDSRSIRDFVGKVLSTFSYDFRYFYWRFEPHSCSLLPPEGAEMDSVLDGKTQKQAIAIAMRFFQEDWSPRRPYDWPDQAKVVLTTKPQKDKRGQRYLPDLRKIWDEIRISSDARGFLLSCSLEVKLTPRIMIRRKTGPLGLNQLSDGEQRLFSLFVDIARQLSLRSPHNEIGAGEAIVLIDEIDVHLHPKWQRKIVPALEDLFRGCQFIATTHSPFVIQATNRGKIISIGQQGQTTLLEDGNSIEDIAENIQGIEVPQRSIRAEKLSKAAGVYFEFLKQMEARPELKKSIEFRSAEQRYREASEPFTSDPAVHALLKVQLLEGKAQ